MLALRAATGTKLPSHRDLAVELGVAPLTMRQVLSHLEDEGLVSRQVSRGTFVREASRPVVLVIASGPTLRAFLADYTGRAGYRLVHPANLGRAEHRRASLGAQGERKQIARKSASQGQPRVGFFNRLTCF